MFLLYVGKKKFRTVFRKKRELFAPFPLFLYNIYARRSRGMRIFFAKAAPRAGIVYSIFIRSIYVHFPNFSAKKGGVFLRNIPAQADGGHRCRRGYRKKSVRPLARLYLRDVQRGRLGQFAHARNRAHGQAVRRGAARAPDLHQFGQSRYLCLPAGTRGERHRQRARPARRPHRGREGERGIPPRLRPRYLYPEQRP